MTLGCMLRRSLRGGGRLLSRSFLLERKAAWVVPEKWVSCCHLSSSIPHKCGVAWEEPFEVKAEAGVAWEEPFEVKAEAEAETGEGQGGSGSAIGPTGRLGRQLIRLNADACATPLLQQWLDDGNPLPKNVAIVAITNLKRHRRYKHALEVADFIWSKHLFDLDDTDHMYRLYLTGQVGTIEDVERCFAEIPTECASERVYNQLMSCYIARGMIAQAENALEKLKESGQPVSALPFSQFLSLYGQQQQYNKAFKLMEDMKAAKIIPDTRTYNILISLTQKQGDTDKVLSFHKAMKDTGVALDSVTYSLLIKAYMESGMKEEAQHLVDEMMSRSPEDRLLANDLMLAVYADQGKEKELKKLWGRIRSTSNLSARSYGVMIESLGKLGLIQEAEDLATKAERKRGRLVARIFNALFHVYARHGRMQAAEELMLRIVKERLRPSIVTYSHLISGYLKLGQLDKALEYLKSSRESLTYDHSKPWLASFLLVLDYLAERGEVELAELTFETFTAAGPYRSTLVYNTLLKAYLKSSTCPKDFVERMSNDGFVPDSETLAMLANLESFSSN